MSIYISKIEVSVCIPKVMPTMRQINLAKEHSKNKWCMVSSKLQKQHMLPSRYA
jgi:hypothetical protein